MSITKGCVSTRAKKCHHLQQKVPRTVNKKNISTFVEHEEAESRGGNVTVNAHISKEKGIRSGISAPTLGT